MNADVPALMPVEGNLQLLKDLSLLRSFSELDLFHLDQENLLYSALKLWIDNIGVDSGCVCLREDEAWQPIASLSWDLDAGYLRNSPAFLKKLTEDTSLLDSEASEASLVSREEGGFLLLPLRCNQQVLGMLGLFHSEPGFLREEHQRLGVIFANLLARAMQFGRMARDMQREVSRRMASTDAVMQETLQLKRKFERLSFVDELTQLHNRRYFMQEARLALARDLRTGTPFTLLLLDLDHFKRINDRFGHVTGDAVLRSVATFLKSRVRKTDILARLGGEEFAVALPGTDIAGAKRMCTSLLEGLRQQGCHGDGGVVVRVTLSIGMASSADLDFVDGETDLERIYQLSDQALYSAKQGGRNQCCNYSEMRLCHL